MSSRSSDSENEEQIDLFGPPLPPNFKKESFGPDLPPHMSETQIGPALPAHLLEKQETHSFGPSLPPHLENSNDSCENPSYGPVLPPKLSDTGQSSSSRCLGPELPPGFNPPDSEDEEDDSFGPDPRLMVAGNSTDYNEVDERIRRARQKMMEKNTKKIERETWMLDLPPERAANLGLGPRQFRAKPAPEMGDRSIWTDTPVEKAKKEKLPPKVNDKDLIRKQLIAERDKEMEKMAEKAESKLKRKESLLDTHTKKLKKQAKDGTKTESTSTERKRFNREEDMQVNRFDEAQKKAIFKKAQLLNDRFSQGESKFL